MFSIGCDGSVQQGTKLFFEIVSQETLRNDLALGVDQHVEGNYVEFKGLDGFAAPELQITDMGPGEVIGADGFLPGIAFPVEGDAEDRKILSFEFIVHTDDIRILGATGSAPAGPE